MARFALPLNVFANLDFGAPAAERDIGRGLEKYFIESVAYKRVRSGAKTIILGNRGSGKSAIFQILASRERSAGSHVIELSPEDYSYELLSSTMTAEKSGSWVKHGAYAAACPLAVMQGVFASHVCGRSLLTTGPGAAW